MSATVAADKVKSADAHDEGRERQDREQPSEKGPGAAAAKRRKRPVVVGSVILIVFGIGALVFGRVWLRNEIRNVSTDDAVIDGDHVSVSAKIVGRIKNLLAAEGDSVNRGQLLIGLDDSDLIAQKAQAIAALNAAEKNVDLAKTDLDKSRADNSRMKGLFDGGATTREQFDHASEALDHADAQYQFALAQVQTARAQLGVVEAQLRNTIITAPIAGVIAKKAFSQGDVVQPGQAIFVINNLGSLWITANFEETKINRIRAGASALVAVDAYGSREFHGQVTMIGSGIVAPPFSIGEFTKTTQRIPVKIMLNEIRGDIAFRPGMSAEVEVDAENSIDYRRFGPAAGIVKGIIEFIAPANVRKSGSRSR